MRDKFPGAQSPLQMVHYHEDACFAPVMENAKKSNKTIGSPSNANTSYAQDQFIHACGYHNFSFNIKFLLLLLLLKDGANSSIAH